MANILVLCTGNACRSQMAHGYLEHFGGDSVAIYSAGVETHGLNQNAVKVMKEDGVDIAHHTSNHVDEYNDIQFDAVITVCDNANEKCPFFPGKVKRTHKSFSDPGKATGTEEEILNEFRKVRDEIKAFAETYLATEFSQTV